MSLTEAPGAPGAARHRETLQRLVGLPIHRHIATSLDRYVDLLLGPGVEHGLIGPREADRIWERHILNCASLAPLLSTKSAVADLGSGAGLPGVVLAVVRPDVTFTLIEPLLRRAQFLRDVIDALGLEGISVLRERAEDHDGPTFDVVVARAVAPLNRLAGWALPLLKPGGVLLAVKGRQADDELARHRAALERMGADHLGVQRLGRGVLAEPATVVTLRRGRGGERPPRATRTPALSP